MRRLVLLAALVVLAGCGGGSDGGNDDTVAQSVEEQLGYLDPHSSAVIAIDLRYEERNWKHVRDVASRALRSIRANADPDERNQIPPNVTGALNLGASFVGLSFDEDIKPLLDGHLVVGLTQRPVPPLPEDVQALRRRPPQTLSASEQDRLFEAQADQDEASQPRVVAVYRTREGDGLRDVIEKLAEGEKPRPVPGHDDAVVIDDIGVVGDDTLVFVEGDNDSGRMMRETLDRADEDDAGVPVDRLAAAEKAASIEDPFVLAAGDRTIARAFVEEPSLQRATQKVPWIGAIRSVAGAVGLDAKGAALSGVVATDPRSLTDRDLPLAPAGDLDLPKTDMLGGGSRDQSFTTTFLSRTARALFADSDFARAVERAERDLGVEFEDEVLRQFSCPSLSEFDPAERRFAARSCVKDPERMRALLPRLSKHLPRILTTMQRLDAQGLVGLLLIAPDAPTTPSFRQLAAIDVKPLRGFGRDVTLYRISGLREDFESELARSAPDEVVFGMIGDTFVVGSDAEMARQAARLEGERFGERAASAIRFPAAAIADQGADDDETQALRDLNIEIRVSASADRSALKAHGRIDVGG
jgi:hypothetical protein